MPRKKTISSVITDAASTAAPAPGEQAVASEGQPSRTIPMPSRGAIQAFGGWGTAAALATGHYAGAAAVFGAAALAQTFLPEEGQK